MGYVYMTNKQLELCCVLNGRTMVPDVCTCGFKICDGCVGELQKGEWDGKRFDNLTVVADLHDEFSDGKCPRFINVMRKSDGA